MPREAPSAPGLSEVAIIGAGSMGVGIAIAHVLAGIKVVLIDANPAALQQGAAKIGDAVRRRAARGDIATAGAEKLLAAVRTSTDLALVATADVIIECVYEQMRLKREIFTQMDRHARPGALLASNTSTLDIDELGAATSRPQDVIGLHFFIPAHVNPLLEIVRGARTSHDAIGRALELARQIGKTAVVARVCPGFIGNRILMARETQSRLLLLEGALPEQIDRVLVGFGFPIGSFQLNDMSAGVELTYRMRQETGELEPIGDALYAAGRLGQKIGKGYYDYGNDAREGRPSPEVRAIIEQASAQRGYRRRAIPDMEVEARLILPMINEGAKIVEEGVAIRPSDIDLVYVLGYGWPRQSGGPMYYADQLGLRAVRDRLAEFAVIHGDFFHPAALLTRLGEAGGSFADLNESSL